MKKEKTIDLLRQQQAATRGASDWTMLEEEIQLLLEEESEMNVDSGQAIQGSFKSFCSRMYLDYSDETSDPYAERLEKKDYIAKYKDWLRKQFILKKGIV